MLEMASSRAAFAASLSLAATAASTFLMDVLTADLMDLFLAAFVLFTRILFLRRFNVSQTVHLQYSEIKIYSDLIAGADTETPDETCLFILFHLEVFVNTYFAEKCRSCYGKL